MVKKLVCVLMAAVLVMSLAACGQSKDVDIKALSQELKAASIFTEPLTEQNDSIVKSMVLLDTDLCELYEFYMTTGFTGEEFGVFKCKTAEDAKTLETQLEARKTAQYNAYVSYNQEAVPRIENTIIKVSGNYVVYVVANDSAAAQEIVNKYI